MNNTNDSKESKGSLIQGDIPQGISGMHPVETSSVISEPTEGGVAAEPTMTTLISTSLTSFNKLPPTMSEKETR